MTSSNADPRFGDPFLTQAYALTDIDAAMAFYSEWAEEYDDRMESTLGYIAPRVMANRLADHMSDTGGRVLDAGCGTGLTAHYLAGRGFERIDGLDLSPKMLARSHERGIHNALIEADLTEPLPIDDEHYDAVISSGTFTLGHVGSEAIPELVRVLRRRGFFGCSIHRDLWEEGGFATLFTGLEQQSMLRTVAVEPGEFFTGLGETALYCIFEKTG